MNVIAKSLPALLLACFLSFFSGHAQTNTGAIVLSVESAVARPGEQVCVRVSGTGLADVIGMQYSVIWDAQVLALREVTELGLPRLSQNDFGFALQDQGALTFAYLTPIGEVLPDSVGLFTLCFDVVGAAGTSTPVTLSNQPTAVEFVAEIENIADVVRNYTLMGGNVAVSATPQDVSPFRIDMAGPVLMTCLSGGALELSVTGAGGTPPYSYLWQGTGGLTASGAAFTVLRAGPYVLTARDAAGNALQSIYYVVETDLEITGFTKEDASCAGIDDGSAAVSISGGTGDLHYRWSTGAEGVSSLDGLPAGTHAVTVSDALGCAVVQPVEIKTGPGVGFTPEVTSPDCGAADGAIKLNAYSQDGGIRYNWSDGLASGDEATGLVPGLYYVTATDVKGCRASEVFDLSWTPLRTGAGSSCGLNADNVVEYLGQATPVGGTGPYDFSWSTGDTENDAATSTVTLPGEGSYTLTVTDAEGCTATTTLEVAACGGDSPVWPGDTDSSGLVNHYDLLPIGLGYDQDGPAREQPSLAWLAQPAFDWSGALPQSLVNYKFADADGNGRIEAADTLAIATHWGNVSDAGGLEAATSPASDDASIYVEGAALRPAENASLPIVLETGDQDIKGAYGIAFSIAYDSLAILPETVQALIDPSWLGDPASTLLHIQRNHPGERRLDLALIRNDRQTVDGGGPIARLAFTTSDAVPGGAPLYNLPFRIENVRFIDNGEQLLGVSPQATTATLEGASGVNDPALLRRLRLYPNPAGERVRLETGDLTVQRIELFSTDGRRHQAWNTGGELDLHGVRHGGHYLLRVISAEGVANLPLLIMR